MSVWAVYLRVIPLGTDRQSGNGVPDWWLDSRDRPSEYPRTAANAARVSTWYVERRGAWLDRVLSVYTAEAIAIALHPLDADVPSDGARVVLTSDGAESLLMRELEHALTRHAVSRLVCSRSTARQLRECMCRHDLHAPKLDDLTRKHVRRMDVEHATPGHVQDIARALGWPLPPVDVYTPWLAGDVAACGRIASDWLTLGLRLLERERLIPDLLDLARR
jgi:hypothetical protein